MIAYLLEIANFNVRLCNRAIVFLGHSIYIIICCKRLPFDEHRGGGGDRCRHPLGPRIRHWVDKLFSSACFSEMALGIPVHTKQQKMLPPDAFLKHLALA